MIRLMGAVLVAAGAACLGFQAAEGLHRQVRELRQMSAGLGVLEGELELNAPPLSRLLELGAGRSQGAAQVLFQGCLQGLDRLDREDFPTLWRRLSARQDRLGQEGQALLLPLGDVLGRYEAGRQIETLAAVRRRLEGLADRLEEENRGRSRVYQALGLSGGAFLVIMLL